MKSTMGVNSLKFLVLVVQNVYTTTSSVVTEIYMRMTDKWTANVFSPVSLITLD